MRPLAAPRKKRGVVILLRVWRGVQGLEPPVPDGWGVNPGVGNRGGRPRGVEEDGPFRERSWGRDPLWE